MKPLEKKDLLKNKFRKINQERKNNNKEIISFSKLDLDFEPSTFDWFRKVNGGNRDYE